MIWIWQKKNFSEINNNFQEEFEDAKEVIRNP